MNKVLIVEDNRQFLDDVARSLEMRGYKALKAENGRQALQQIEENKDILLMILDVVLPDFNAMEILQKISRLDRKVPVVICTVRDKLVQEYEFTFPFVRGFISKRMGIRKIIDQIENVLAGSKVEAIPETEENANVKRVSMELRKKLNLEDGSGKEIVDKLLYLADLQNINRIVLDIKGMHCRVALLSDDMEASSFTCTESIFGIIGRRLEIMANLPLSQPAVEVKGNFDVVVNGRKSSYTLIRNWMGTTKVFSLEKNA